LNFQDARDQLVFFELERVEDVELLGQLVELGLRLFAELRRCEQRRTNGFDLREVFAEVLLRVETLLLMVAPRTTAPAGPFGTVRVGTIVELQRIISPMESRASYATK